MATQGARIRELHDDTAEELKVIHQDIKQLDERVQSGFLEIGKAFDLNASNIEAVKQAVASVKADVGRLEGKIDMIVKLLQK
jgi:uncharacterized coiled-coil protein SlyX